MPTGIFNFSSFPSKLLCLINRHWFILITLASITLLTHHSALSGFWRFDDGWLLGFAACYAPQEYFFIPAITREISYAFLTPWLPLAYDINLALFHLNPLGYYAHQLLSLCLVAYLSFILLHLWVKPSWAILGAILFLIGLPTVYIAQELMTIHYLEGLIFACIAIYGFVRVIRDGNKYWLLLGVLGYTLACTCKEIYVPIPILLFALPEGNWKKRLVLVAPFLIITLFYLSWRTIVLGTIIGGYAHEPSTSISFSKILLTYIRLPTLLFRNDLLGYLAIIALIILLLLKTDRRSWWLFLSAIGTLLLPLAPLAILGLLESPTHYLFLVWWYTAMATAILAGRQVRFIPRYLCVFLIVLIGVASLHANYTGEKALLSNAKPLEALYHFTLTADHQKAIIPSTVALDSSWEYAQFIYNGLLSAASGCGSSPRKHPKLLSSVEAIVALDPKETPVYRYDPDCNCLKDISSIIPALLSSFPTKQQNSALLIRFLPPPYQPRRDQPRITDTNANGGRIEKVTVNGKTVEISGWARLRDDEPKRGIAIFVPDLPIKHSLTLIERPDVAKYLNNSHYLNTGFRIILQFSSSANAKNTVVHFCAQKLAGGSFAPIENPENLDCSLLFRQR